MKSRELFKKWKEFIIIECSCDRNDINELEQIQKDLEILEFIKTHYKMNGFNELIPFYLDYNDDEKFNKLERWLENE